jgi:hypothetical protein
MVETSDERLGFAARVMPSGGPRDALADGIKWMRPGDRLHVTRKGVIDFDLEIIHPTLPTATAKSRIPIISMSPVRVAFVLDSMRTQVSKAEQPAEPRE